MMAREEDEIQLVDAAAGMTDEEEEEEGMGIVFEGEVDRSSCIRLGGYNEEEEEEEDSEPRVEDERHIKHPGKLNMRLRKLRSSRSKRWYWWITVAFLTVSMILLVGVPVGIWSDQAKETCFDYESDDESSEQYPFLFLGGRTENFYLCEKGRTKLKGALGKNHGFIKEERVDVYLYTADTLLNITRLNDNCLRMEWKGESSAEEPILDCFVMYADDKIIPELRDVKWFGGHELYNQTWPLSDVWMNMSWFLPQDYLASIFSEYQSRSSFGPVLHPLWLASNGVGILVDRTTPLSVSIHQGERDGEICLQSVPYNLECIPESYEVSSLKYTICARQSIAATAKYFLEEHIDHPRGVPARETFEHPMWSTRPVLGTTMDTTEVKNYLSAIKTNGFGISQLELGDGYGGPNSSYGDLSMVIDTSNLVSNFDVKLTAWVHPFVNPKCNLFGSRIDEDFFLPGRSKIEGDSVSLVRWWHDYGAVINFLDDSVAYSHKEALVEFMANYGLSSLNFDAGEVTYLPKCVYIRDSVDPADFTRAYAGFAGNFSDEVTLRASVRVGYFSQQEPLWVRMMSRASEWGTENGLKSVLTTALTFGIAGYPFVLPDVIGGSGEDPGNLDPSARNPTLYIRWLQLSTFLPAMHFSLPPFHESFSDFTEFNIVQHALNLTNLHKSLAETFYNLSLEAVETGHPIIRPIWWIDDSPHAIQIDDQFLIGDSMMVAPILDLTTSRCVYFPSDTQWTRYNHKNSIYPDSSDDCTPETSTCEHGCRFTVTLSEFLYFTRIES